MLIGHTSDSGSQPSREGAPASPQTRLPFPLVSIRLLKLKIGGGIKVPVEALQLPFQDFGREGLGVLVHNCLVADHLGTAHKLQGAEGLVAGGGGRADVGDDHALGVASQTVLHLRNLVSFEMITAFVGVIGENQSVTCYTRHNSWDSEEENLS